eukprot:scaffold68498_cov35-Cyclotella_meneghiniana.AAC.2
MMCTARQLTRGAEVNFDFCSEEGRAEGCTDLHSRALFSAHKKSQGPVDEARRWKAHNLS